MNNEYYSDPVFPLLSHPSTYRSRRHHASFYDLKQDKTSIFRAKGPGCIKMMWICLSNNLEAPDKVNIEIYADGAKKPQVDMSLYHFFGILLNRYPYRVDCAAFQVLPRYIDPKAAGGYGFTSYIPIPFESSCEIYLSNSEESPVHGSVYADWHQYMDDADMTPYRLHAEYHGEFPPEHRSSFLMADIDGRGFVAGIFKGIEQKNHRDMIYHTGGQTWLMDGETDAHAIHGCNEEDDFGLHWGYQETMSPLVGCPYLCHKHNYDQDGVIYRFFSNDAIQFKNSLYLTSQARSDNTETTVYFYLRDGVTPPVAGFQFIPEWQAVGTYPCPDYEVFRKGEAPEFSADLWGNGDDGLRSGRLTAHHGWLNMWPLFIRGEDIETSAPECRADVSAYLRTRIYAEQAGDRTFQLTFCNYAAIWLNGKLIAVYDHGDEFCAENINLLFKRGNNKLLLKTSHVDFRKNAHRDLWTLNCKLLGLEAADKHVELLRNQRFLEPDEDRE